MEILNNIHFIFTYEMDIKRGEIMNVFDIFFIYCTFSLF